MEYHELVMIGRLFAVFLIFSLTAFLVWIGTKITKIERKSFSEILLATFLCSVTSNIFSLIIPFIGWLLGIVVSIMIIKFLFKTNWVEAIIIWAIPIGTFFVIGFIFGLAR